MGEGRLVIGLLAGGRGELGGLSLTGNRVIGCTPDRMEALLTADDSVLPSELAGLPFCWARAMESRVNEPRVGYRLGEAEGEDGVSC